MEWFNILTARLRALFRRESVLRDIEEELRVHVEMETETNIRRGMLPDEARAAALKSFGNPVRNTELGYDILGGGWLETFWQDLRYGARMLLKKPGFTLIVALSLALGIGANTAIFSLLDAVALKTLPVRKPQELVLFNWLSGPKRMARNVLGDVGTDQATGLTTSTSFSYLSFERLRDHNQSLANVFAFTPLPLSVHANDQAEFVQGQLVSG